MRVLNFLSVEIFLEKKMITVPFIHWNLFFYIGMFSALAKHLLNNPYQKMYMLFLEYASVKSKFAEKTTFFQDCHYL